ncbi:aminoacyl tRNA synthase complex-interacting multifunctional protein 1 [Cylas formicarius]|uniref:aminoacyl tRNA synthase complex-interacting multifunctional protein 1 n=1 Tax=Cylas formicarius TaxID=197179 RepID=UPI002958AA30|nr:aminoacyl tRNA synthase complex-interacting multifunctional protein 1 [Cylas formicarius]XP_060525581.1 aminoacyl tRNA synthase complex-interacting multifunctional protein 1 [Cylas formicarius]
MGGLAAIKRKELFVLTDTKRISLFASKMPEATSSLDRIRSNANLMKQTINDIKSKLNELTTEYNRLLCNQLREENSKLSAAVETAKEKLVRLEIQNGVKQVAVPGARPAVTSEATEKQIEVSVEEKQTKTKVAKPKKEPSKTDKTNGADLPVDVGRLDLRVGKVENVERHPDADSLYVLKINCGENEPRTVCSGLVKHVPLDELRDKTVMVLCNLKPVKMRGITSEAMVMCASGENGVEVLAPPPGCRPGDLVTCEGFERRPDPVMNPKKKIFETVAPDLHTNDNLEACYKGVPLAVEGKGTFASKTLRNVAVK